MSKVTRIVAGATRVGEEGSALLLYSMMAVIVSNVFLRFLGRPLPALFEIMAALAVGIIGLALAGSQRKKTHVSIDLVTKNFPQRIQDVLAGVLTLVIIGFWGVVIFGLTRYTSLSIDSGAASDILRLPNWPQLVLLIIGLILLVLVLLVDFGRRAKAATTGKEIEAVW